jgi:hypothetical protein
MVLLNWYAASGCYDMHMYKVMIMHESELKFAFFSPSLFCFDSFRFFHKDAQHSEPAPLADGHGAVALGACSVGDSVSIESKR